MNRKARFYASALDHFPSLYPRVKLASVWSERWQNDDETWSDLRVNSSKAALAAYRDGVAAEYFIGFGGLVLPTAGAPIAPPVSGCYLGAYPGWGEYEDAATTQGLKDFETLTEKAVACSPFSAYWGRDVASRDPLDAIGSYGAAPELRLMPWGEPYLPGPQPAYALGRIIDGEFDGYLERWADVVKDYGRPIFATFAVEMNGDWFPWSGVHNGGGATEGYGDAAEADGPERYVDAYRHVVDLFRGRDVANVTWVWQVNYDSVPAEDWNRASAYYPGNDYVDWVGMSVYGALTREDKWRAFDDVIAPMYAELTSAFPDKPLMVAEWGVMQR